MKEDNPFDEARIWFKVAVLGLLILILLGYCCRETVASCQKPVVTPARSPATSVPTLQYIP